MAAKDVKQYYYKMMAQAMEMQADLDDYNEAFRNGFITEDQLADAKADIDIINQNYERLKYIVYLLDLPNRSKKKDKYRKSKHAKMLEEQFKKDLADEQSVIAENEQAHDSAIEKIQKLI